MPTTEAGRERSRRAVIESNRRRGEQNPELRRARLLFNQHRWNAKLRDVPWLLTFEQWYGIWVASGKWALRGPRIGQYCMARKGDSGPYAVGNVYIELSTVNVADGTRGRKRTPEQNAARSEWMRGNSNGSGMLWVSKDGVSRHVKADVADTLIAEGWSRGREAMKKRTASTSGDAAHG